MSSPAPQPARKSRADLLAYLRALGIDAATHEHPPVFTVEDNKALRGDLPGLHCKNLFLKDKKDQLWLAVLAEDRAVDTKDLRRRIGAAHLSFGRPDALMATLGVEPGAVTPFGVLNDRAGAVRVVLDKAVTQAEVANFHPLDNAATTAIRPADLLAFFEATGHPPLVVDLDAPAPDPV